MADRPPEFPEWIPDPSQANFFTRPPQALITRGWNDQEAPDPGIFNYQNHWWSRWIKYLDQEKLSVGSVDVTKAYVDEQLEKAKGYTDLLERRLAEARSFKSFNIEVSSSNIESFKAYDSTGKEVTEETDLKNDFLRGFFDGVSQSLSCQFNDMFIKLSFNWKSRQNIGFFLSREFAKDADIYSFYDLVIVGRSSFNGIPDNGLLYENQNSTLSFPTGLTYYIRVDSGPNQFFIVPNPAPFFSHAYTFFQVSGDEYRLSIRLFAPTLASTVGGNLYIKVFSFNELRFLDSGIRIA